MTKKLLDSINFPEDLRKLSTKDLTKVCGELRNFLIKSVAQSGGHFGSNLGVVELTVALHYVFETPKDLLVWDVGHQTYPHKILTGRKDKIHTIRQKDGLAPFPKKSESIYDVFDVGHSSTSISAGLGMAMANNNDKQIVVVIGDGALTGGMALEALNHTGYLGANLLVILNDNQMSISPNVGAIHRYLTRLTSSRLYNELRQRGRRCLRKVPAVHKLAHHFKKQIKGTLIPGTFFEELGFEYYGPIDGHRVKSLVKTLENLKKIPGPKLLHIVTKKGKGYIPAEKDVFSLHAVKPFSSVSGLSKIKEKKKKTTYTKVFSDWICAMGEKDKKLQAITPAMSAGSGLVEFSKKFPSRFFDVGIAEQHAVTFAGGLAREGKKPVVAIYSSFLQRAYDQIIHDIALQNLDVLFAVDRAGIVGPDGATHAGSFDLSFLRPIPNLIIMTPADENECYAMLQFGYKYQGPTVVRYPRGNGPQKYFLINNSPLSQIEIGQSKIIREGERIAILAFGAMVERCKLIAEKFKLTLVNMRFVKPLDNKMLKKLAKKHKFFVTVEDNVIIGGAGTAVNEFVLNNNLSVQVNNIGLPDEFLEHGSREEILSLAGLDVHSIENRIKKILENYY